MMTVVTCRGCGKAGEFDVKVTFTTGRKGCGSCGHQKQNEWTFHFCILNCMIEWMTRNQVAERGFPCGDCVDYRTGESSGYAHGFEENGRCATCKGEKTVRGRLVAEDPLAAGPKAL